MISEIENAQGNARYILNKRTLPSDGYNHYLYSRIGNAQQKAHHYFYSK